MKTFESIKGPIKGTIYQRSIFFKDACTFWTKKPRIFRNLWFIRTDKGRGEG